MIKRFLVIGNWTGADKTQFSIFLMPLKLMSKPSQNLLKNFSESPFAVQKIIKDQKQHKSPVVSCRLKLILKRVMEVVEVARRRLVVSVISFRTEGGGDEVNARQAKIFGPDRPADLSAALSWLPNHYHQPQFHFRAYQVTTQVHNAQVISIITRKRWNCRTWWCFDCSLIPLLGTTIIIFNNFN